METPNVVQMARETRSSIEVTRNRTGDYQWVMKLYFEEGHEAQAIVMLGTIDEELRTYFLTAA